MVLTASAQYTSRLGRFQVDQVKGCAPFTLTITNTNLVTTGECTPGKPCLMDFLGNGTNATNTFSFTYTTAGTYKLSVLYQNIGADDITVTVFANTAPTYEVYTCTGNQVSLKVTDKTYDTYVIDFNNDGTPETIIPSGNNAVASHNYGVAGNYNIAVRGKNVNSADNCQNKVEAYQTLPVLPTPSINIATAQDANTIKLDMTTAPHIQYKMEIALNNSSNFQVYQNLYQVSTVTVPNLLLDVNYYCFRLSAFDPCSGNNNYSNVICSQDFDVTFQNGVNVLAWRTGSGGVASVTIMRNGTSYSTIPGAPLGFQDRDYDCNVDYCYQLIVNYSGGKKSTSLSKCGTGILVTTFPAIDNLSTQVVSGGGGVDLIWKSDPKIKVAAYEVLRAQRGTTPVFYTETQSQKFNDQTYSNESNVCYQVNYRDLCDNRSLPGIIACPMVLQGTLDDRNAATLTWSKFNGWVNGVNTYQVEKYNRSGSLIQTFSTNDTTLVDFDPNDPEQIVTYVINAVSNQSGVVNSISNKVTLEKPVRLISPTAFTPNGDAINPTFTIAGKFVARMSLKIFDRWGALVFTTEKNEPWDGTRAGRPMPESSYVWKAEGVDTAGHTFVREGTVLLLNR